MKVIPVSEIDSLIKQLEDYSKFLHEHDDHKTLTIKAEFEVIELLVIPNLRGLKEKAIPAVTIEQIDEKINELSKELKTYESPDSPFDKIFWQQQLLQDFKREI